MVSVPKEVPTNHQIYTGTTGLCSAFSAFFKLSRPPLYLPKPTWLESSHSERKFWCAVYDLESLQSRSESKTQIRSIGQGRWAVRTAGPCCRAAVPHLHHGRHVLCHVMAVITAITCPLPLHAHVMGMQYYISLM
jgi:hypothetical protein